MAITDALLTVSDEQAVTATAVSTDSIDLGVNRDIGAGEQLYMLFTCTEAATAAGAATVTFEVIASAAGALTSPVVVGASGAVGKAALTVGEQIAVPIGRQTGLGLRYLGARYTVGTGPLTAGKFTATVVRNVPDTGKFYPTNIVV